ncbi:hypothetical protein barba126A_phanotate39 [Rheinheimera phage vB_RspM_barba_12-6A]|uniref:Uncharacterized protein n=31 Tax=Barbavirus barba18A TaxID=2734090 RepID=A0A7G9VS64_9CAUD|nr:hypothetical protein barba13A_phanotate151 [Rheinheimera phage vB_RspM_barba_1-3A]QNO01662.1 hypothetical protein barba108A_phanotate151 [Rheinheimera phage vB_RspM_barba_10-8A]QNO01789.1 hypothetical protein barba108B_phanotate118 [Rheinheimera phage vB_RspM_barba_10-8B]QNO01983.1 hypothetical protein barba108D_phanotate152 [Rheinheimera phage vB_RspM_barba_10-8D]QNO02147.1 hypothetical protein barba109A_phanotate155 [Rheinheimera phage vB_RspM_barba_10-9A]QNO02313.1 hypothetical protein b
MTDLDVYAASIYVLPVVKLGIDSGNFSCCDN